MARSAAALTAMELVPTREALTVSMAVMICVPVFSKMAEKFPVPFVSVEVVGR
jgi:hypothetical protein